MVITFYHYLIHLMQCVIRHNSISMVTTRRGTSTGRYEEQRRLFEMLRNQRVREDLIEMFGSDSESESSQGNHYEHESNQRFYHIGHPHDHPGHYTNRDEIHRHRFGRPSRRDEWIPGHYRRRPLF